ncbi:hypothetical protein [Arthrobacter sp. NPDC056727]|uniref:hypothetical protein n=1 Tax=Arthrobacter sp. NPDC056727 TaxID=3345927 RepID=UPI00367000D0
MQDDGLRRQIMGVIGHVLADEATDTAVRMALLRHLGENPGSPELALLAHLRDCGDQDAPRGGGPAEGPC